MKTEDQIPDSSSYKEAFIKLFKCNSSDFTIKVGSDGYSAIAEYNGKKYQIDREEDLFEMVKNDLLDYDECDIEHELIVAAAPGLLSMPEFYKALVISLDKETELPLFHIALQMASMTSRTEDTFWHLLWPLDESSVLRGKCLVAAARVFDGDTLAQRIFDLRVKGGTQYYSNGSERLFTEVELTNEAGEESLMYVYSVSQNTWVA